MLITDIRLKADGGLRLIRLARAGQPAMAVVALASFPDPDVEAEVNRLGATYSLKPMDPQRLLAIVAERVSGPGRERRWIRKRVAGGIRARIGGVRAKVLDMSYGGLKLEISMPPEKEPPPSIEVSLMSFGLSVSADVMWTTGSNHRAPGSAERRSSKRTRIPASPGGAWSTPCRSPVRVYRRKTTGENCRRPHRQSPQLTHEFVAQGRREEEKLARPTSVHGPPSSIKYE